MHLPTLNSEFLVTCDYLSSLIFSVESMSCMSTYEASTVICQPRGLNSSLADERDFQCFHLVQIRCSHLITRQHGAIFLQIRKVSGPPDISVAKHPPVLILRPATLIWKHSDSKLYEFFVSVSDSSSHFICNCNSNLQISSICLPL